MSMDLDAPVPLSAPSDSRPSATILCCNCGAPIDGTTAANALCFDCVKLTHDISSSIPRESSLSFCRDCDRYLLPPQTWVAAAPESRELLALCLRKLKGPLARVRIVDAHFVWTEPHSRRVRVRLTVQDEVAEGVVLQQAFEVVYSVLWQQCPECAKSFTAHVWRACVQVRQKVVHKRTFLFLEQLILRHGAHLQTLNIREAKDGIDFFFSQRNHAEKFVDFLNTVVPVRVKKSQELISQDVHTSTKSYKFTFSAELVPICKDDLVALPIKLAKQLGNIYPLVLCSRVGTSISLIDPSTLQTSDLSSSVYWRSPFVSLADVQSLVEFVVMDLDATPTQHGRWLLSEATVARASDLGRNDRTYFTRTHLGHFLQPGDSAMGYLLAGTNFNSSQLEAIEEAHAYGSSLPDVVLVKKHYRRRRRHQRRRNWKLRRMEGVEADAGRKGEQDRAEKEYEMFLRDVEEDEEMRSALALYKDKRRREAEEMSVVESEDDEGNEGDDDVPRVDMEELLEDFDDLTVQDRTA